MKRKLKVQHAGAEIEIELPEGVLTAEEVDEGYVPKPNVESIVRDRLKKALTGTIKKDEALDDEEFKTEALARWGIDASKDGKFKANAEAIAAARKDWERTDLEPTQKKLTAAEARTARLLNAQLKAEILQAATAANVRKEFLTPIDEGGEAPFVNQFAPLFGFHEESDSFALKLGDGFHPSSKPDAKRPYRGVSEFIKTWAGTDNAKPYLDASKQSGPGARPDGGSTGSHRLSREDAKDPVKYRTAREAADKAGVELQIEQGGQ